MTEIVAYGRAALLVRGDGLDPVETSERISALEAAEVIDVVAGAETVLVDTAGPDSVESVRARLEALLAGVVVEQVSRSVRTITLPVRFDGADLDEVARRCGVEIDEVVRRVAASPLRVAFCGFAPGFAYLDGLDRTLHLARRDTPRTRVPPGSFAIAAGYAAVYPAASPGGWHLIGSTAAEVWDVGREEPALLAPGCRITVEVEVEP